MTQQQKDAAHIRRCNKIFRGDFTRVLTHNKDTNALKQYNSLHKQSAMAKFFCYGLFPINLAVEAGIRYHGQHAASYMNYRGPAFAVIGGLTALTFFNW